MIIFSSLQLLFFVSGSTFCSGTKPVIDKNVKDSLAHINYTTTIYNYCFAKIHSSTQKKQANRLLTHMVAICTLFKWACSKPTTPRTPCPRSLGAGSGSVSAWTAPRNSSKPQSLSQDWSRVLNKYLPTDHLE